MNDRNNTFITDKAWSALPAEIEEELDHILRYWETFTPDTENGGFAGRINEKNQVQPQAPRGSVLYARILWAFSAAFRHTGNQAELDMATRAFHYIRDYLEDRESGGLFWTVDYKGKMLDGHKQIYALAFGIYGMSEYYRVTKDEIALDLALNWYRLIEKYSRDLKQGGYIDAFARDWSFLEDKRLSAKDENSTKTMNTHLHVVEAYANLYQVYPTEKLLDDILSLLNIFDKKIIHPVTHHLGLFFSENWDMDDSIISYGHDMEAGWLLQACAEVTGNEDAIRTSRINAVRITVAAMEGMDSDGGLWYEYNAATKKLVSEKHWWPQAEALIGFCNVWQLNGNPVYKKLVLDNWHFIRTYLIDSAFGEWLWGIDGYKMKMPGQDKVGIWKCPYHNIRACLELLKRLKS